MPATMVIIADRKAPGKRPAIEREAADPQCEGHNVERLIRHIALQNEEIGDDERGHRREHGPDHSEYEDSAVCIVRSNHLNPKHLTNNAPIKTLAKMAEEKDIEFFYNALDMQHVLDEFVHARTSQRMRSTA